MPRFFRGTSRRPSPRFSRFPLARGGFLVRRPETRPPASREREANAGSRGAYHEWPEVAEAERLCGHCGRWLPRGEFPAHKARHSRLSSWCRECHRQSTREWRTRNRDEDKARRRERYRAAHPLPDRTCVVCGGPLGQRKIGALVCSARCREKRKRVQRREVRAKTTVRSPRGSDRKPL
jgi:predicted nucleic acid-binding Zn ribbon protein